MCIGEVVLGYPKSDFQYIVDILQIYHFQPILNFPIIRFGVNTHSSASGFFIWS